MSEVKITKRTVDAAEPRGSRYTVFDSLIPGFGLRVFPTGVKSWVFRYRPGAGGRSAEQKCITIGRVADFTPDQARKRADTLRSMVKHGDDPQGAKAADRAASTVEKLAEAFMRDHVEAKRGEGTQVRYRDILDRIVVPTLGKIKAKDLDGAEVAKLHRAWRHTPFQANRILSTISSMYSFGGAHSQKLVPRGTNPASGIEKYPEPSRQRLLSTEELQNLGTALRMAETTGIPWRIEQKHQTSKHLASEEKRWTVISPFPVAAIRLLIFTGARLREILNLRWDQVDFDRGMLLLGKHKTARVVGVKAIVLNAPALEVLATLPRIGAFVIAGDNAGTEKEKPRPDIKKPWATIRGQAGLGDVRLNDLRHNFASFGAGGGLGLPIIGKLLGHTQPSTTARYAHLQSDPLRRAANTIGADISVALNGPSDGADVVRIDKAKQR